MSDIREKLIQLATNPLMDDNQRINELMSIVHNHHKGDTLNMFLKLQDMERKRIDTENQVLRMGLECGLNLSAHSIRTLIENKTSKQAKTFAKLITDDEHGIYSLIHLVKAYFPDGLYNAASNNGRWVLNTFVNLIIRFRKEFEDKESSTYRWMVNQGHEKYIKLILDNYKNALYKLP